MADDDEILESLYEVIDAAPTKEILVEALREASSTLKEESIKRYYASYDDEEDN